MEDSNITDGRLLASRSYYTDTLTWCVQKSGPMNVSRQMFTICTDIRVWLFAILATIAIILAGYFAQQFELQKWHSLRLLCEGIACMCAFPCEYRPRLISHRLGFAAFLLASVILSTTVATFVTGIFMSGKFMPQTQTVNDMVKNYELAGDYFALAKLNQQITV